MTHDELMHELTTKLEKMVTVPPAAPFDKVELEYRWYDDDSEEGPFVRCVAGDGRDLGNKLQADEFRKLSSFMMDEVYELRRQVSSTPAPNVLRATIRGNGKSQATLTYDQNVNEEYEKRQRRALGNAAYDANERDRAASREQTNNAAPPTSMQNASSEPSIPELLGFIRNELLKDIPSTWQTLEINAEVWMTGDQQNVSTIYHYREASGDRVRFTSKNVFGPMNAVIGLHQQYRAEGKAWRKLYLRFSKDATSVHVDAE